MADRFPAKTLAVMKITDVYECKSKAGAGKQLLWMHFRDYAKNVWFYLTLRMKIHFHYLSFCRTKHWKDRSWMRNGRRGIWRRKYRWHSGYSFYLGSVVKRILDKSCSFICSSSNLPDSCISEILEGGYKCLIMERNSSQSYWLYYFLSCPSLPERTSPILLFWMISAGRLQGLETLWSSALL